MTTEGKSAVPTSRLLLKMRRQLWVEIDKFRDSRIRNIMTHQEMWAGISRAEDGLDSMIACCTKLIANTFLHHHIMPCDSIRDHERFSQLQEQGSFNICGDRV